VPPNCYFEVDDYESDWSFSRPFDFIHGRVLTGSVRDYPELFRRIKNNLAPNGWAEMGEVAAEPFSDDDSLQGAPNLREWMRLQEEAGLKFGKKMNVAQHYKQWMIDAGFKNVKEEVYKVYLVSGWVITVC
jgi:trans-aconitate methyltransferase